MSQFKNKKGQDEGEKEEKERKEEKEEKEEKREKNKKETLKYFIQFVGQRACGTLWHAS